MKKLNNYIKIGILCVVILLIDRIFNIFSYIFSNNTKNFIDGLLCGLGISLELIGIRLNVK